MTHNFLRLTRVCLALTVISVGLMGCGGVHHRGDSFVLVGQPYPVEVSVSAKKGEDVSGTVYHRVSGETEYHQTPLVVRRNGKWLSASLPIDASEPGQVIEYYIDVFAGEKSYALYSPATPKRVKVVEIGEMVARKVHVEVNYRYDGDPVQFTLRTGGLDVAYAVLTYQAPGIPGWTTVDMHPDRGGKWHVVVPGEHVHAGWWNYRVETEAEGVEHSIPGEYWESFEVRYPPVAKVKVY